MNRRAFLGLVGLAVGLGLTPESQAAANKKFVFRIRTRSGSIVGNILIEARDQFAAVSKLMQRYPGCEILEGRER